MDKLQVTYNFLSGAEHELLVELQQAETILRFPAFDVNPVQELLDHVNDTGQFFLIRIAFRCILQHDTQEEGISSEACRRLSKITVKLKFP